MSDEVQFLKATTYDLEAPTDQKFDFSTGHVEYQSIPDTNTSNVYQTGQIQFTSANLAVQTGDTQYVPREAYFIIPVMHTLTIANGTFTTDGTKLVESNVNAICPKMGNYGFFDRVSEKVGGLPVGIQGNNRQFLKFLEAHSTNDWQRKYYREQILDEFRGDVMSRKYLKATIGECDTSSLQLDTDYSIPQNRTLNTMFYENGKRFISYGAQASNGADQFANNSDVNPFGSTAALSNNVNSEVYNLQPFFVNAKNNLVWYDLLRIPAKELSVLGHLPTSSCLTGLDILLQAPIFQQGVQMQVTYADIGAATQNQAAAVHFAPASFAFSSGIATQYPLLIGQAINSSVNSVCAPLVLRQTTAGTAVTLTLSSKIGWTTFVDNTVTYGVTINGPNARLVIPACKIGSENVSKIARNPISRIDFRDSNVEVTLLKGISGGQFIERQFPQQYSRVCRVFLLPYLSQASNCASGSSLNSPFSLAPVFQAPINLRQLNLTIGNIPVYANAIDNKWLQYELYLKLCASQFNGNSNSSDMRTSLLTFAEFCRSPMYVFNTLDKFESEEEWSVPSQFGFRMNCDYPTGISVDWVVVFERQMSFEWHRISGTIPVK